MQKNFQATETYHLTDKVSVRYLLHYWLIIQTKLLLVIEGVQKGFRHNDSEAPHEGPLLTYTT